MRALIVDDQYVQRRVLQAMLATYGESEGVGSGEDALIAHAFALDEGRPFDLVLLDVEMPGIDGHETLRRIRAEEERRGLSGPAACRVFMATAQDDPKSVFAAFRDQCEAYLLKPVTAAKLQAAMRDHGLPRG